MAVSRDVLWLNRFDENDEKWMSVEIDVDTKSDSEPVVELMGE